MSRNLLRILMLALAASPGPLAPAQSSSPSSPPPIDRVEEDWELVVGMPDLVSAGPQMTTTMSPDGDNSRSFLALNLNYRDVPFRVGGMQLLAWENQVRIAVVDGNRTLPLATPGERITWTQRLSLSGGQLSLAVDNGESWTWGRFGPGNSLSMSIPSSLSSLDGYSPETSVENSGVGWQGNRVRTMTLVRVRYYSGGSLVRTDDTPRPVVASTADWVDD